MTRELTGRHVLFILLAAFGTIFAVNGVFAYFAVSQFPGIETADAYRKGLAFNQQIARADALRDLGWSMTVSREGSEKLMLRFQAADGSALPVSEISALLFHPTSAQGDDPLSVRREAPGQYSAELERLENGKRQLRVRAIGPNGRVIEFRRVLWPN